MNQIPNPGDGFSAPPGGVRYAWTFDELVQRGNTSQQAVEQWMLARLARFEVRSLGCDILLDVAEPSPVHEYQARAWAITMHTPWHVYTVTTPRGVWFWLGVEEACRTIDRAMVERGQAIVMGGAPAPAVPNNGDDATILDQLLNDEDDEP